MNTASSASSAVPAPPAVTVTATATVRMTVPTTVVRTVAPALAPYALAAGGSFASARRGVITGSVDVVTTLSPVRVVFHISGPRPGNVAMRGGNGHFTGRIPAGKSGTYRAWATVTAGSHAISTPAGTTVTVTA